MQPSPPVNVPSIDYEDLFSRLSHYFSTFDYTSWPSQWATFLTYYQLIATIATLLLSIGIFYSAVRLAQVRRKESLVYNAQLAQVYDIKKPQTELNKKWERVLLHIESANSNDWKVAIIEADILLGDMLDELGYQGESIGEKLKRVVKGDMATLDQAWEAHKARNEIAHQSADVVFNQREAKRIIGMYQAVFEEFQSKK